MILWYHLAEIKESKGFYFVKFSDFSFGTSFLNAGIRLVELYLLNKN